ncbi:MAG: thioredoxin domain-containing protein [Chloroflexota bacterium]
MATEVDALGIEVGFTEDGQPYRGSLDAPVVMDEFSDFQCPFCSRFAQETMPTLLEQKIAAGEVRLVFYDFPLTSHPQAAAAANAARCAGEQGAAAYWEMHDRLFENQQEWSNSNANETFVQYANELSLDGAGFSACIEESRYTDAIDANVDYGFSRGVSSTPSFFLNDQPLVGAQPTDVFLQAIAAVMGGETIATAEDAQPEPGVKPTPASIQVDDIAYSLGDPNAPVTMVEYTDYQCPYCARYTAETLPTMLTEMIESGRVYYQIKDFPLETIHPYARQAAVAARCAGAQDAYWSMHDALFSRQSEWAGSDAGVTESLMTIATDLGLDSDAFATCLDSGQFDNVIQDNIDEGITLGVTGTPSFFIDGFPISGAQPYELFEYAITLAEEGTLADAYVQTEEAAEPDPSVPVEVDIEGAYSIGDLDAPVVIVEFTDFQCPYCGRHFQQTFPEIQSNYIDSGLVRYVFKDFPLTNIHPQAELAAQAARCGGEQDGYLEMHHLLFNNQQVWSGQPDAAETFVGFAEEAGLDADSFRSCLESAKYEDAVATDLAEGVSLGVNGTPAFFLNGYFLSGAQPYSVFDQAITQLAAMAGTENSGTE